MKAIKIIAFTIAIVMVTILTQGYFKKEPPEPNYRMLLTNLGYVFIDSNEYITYIQYNDSTKITNITSKEETKPKQRAKKSKKK